MNLLQLPARFYRWTRPLHRWVWASALMLSVYVIVIAGLNALD